LSPRDREELDSVLGRGDIAATMDLAGRSEVWETGFSGVWRVRHFGASEIIVDLIEIASCPEILRSDRRDASLSAQRLSQLLEQKKSAVAETSHEQ
jgi:hydrogenase-1 operon protein HyaF